jgi:Skp family chaperone for outer membrane proteins
MCIMPDMTESQLSAVIVVDLARVLDESALGKQGASALQAKFDDARARYEKLLPKNKSMAAELQAEAIRDIEQERMRLREEVLAKVRPIVAALMSERRALLVVDAAACLAIAEGVDVTAEVLRRM